ncbi:hypothetical protein MR857_13435 [bacterium]|nr:hypothetical protein [bacterium]MDY3022410.1 hypothetical protein [Oliverpabstia sp.]
MKKKLAVLLLSGVMIFSAVACDSDNHEEIKSREEINTMVKSESEPVSESEMDSENIDNNIAKNTDNESDGVTEDYSLLSDEAADLLNQKLKSIGATEIISPDMLDMNPDGDEASVVFYTSQDERYIRVAYVYSTYRGWEINCIKDEKTEHMYWIGKLVENAFDIYDYDTDVLIKEHTTMLEELTEKQ